MQVAGAVGFLNFFLDATSGSLKAEASAKARHEGM